MISEVAERYSSGLFELAKEDNTVESKKEQAESLSQAIETDETLLAFLRAVKVNKDEKKELIEKVFSDAFDHDFISFLKLLVDKGRTYELKEILDCYIALADDYLGIEKAVVYSARKLKTEDLERIQKVLEAKQKKKIVIKNVIDPSCLAGIKVVVGNNVTDATMRAKIDGLKESMLKGGFVS